MVEDRRDSYRFDVQRGQVSIEHPPTLSVARISNISASGSNIIVPIGKMDSLGKSPIKLRLGDYPFIETTFFPIHSIKMDGMIHIGACFQNMHPDSLTVLCQFLIDRFTENSQRFSIAEFEKGVSIIKKHKVLINELLRYYCIFMDYPLQIYKDGHLLSLILKVRSIIEKEGHQLIQIVMNGSEANMVEVNKEYVFTYPGANSVNYFITDVYTIKNDTLFINLPQCIYQGGFRYSRRAALKTNQNIEIVIKHPRFQNLVITKPILEAGARGFSFPLDPEKDFLFPGGFLSDVSIKLPEHLLSAAGTIRSVHKHEGQLVYGFEISRFSNEKDRDNWMRFAFLATHEQLKIGGYKDRSTYWAVLEASGYINNEVTLPLRSVIKKSYMREWDKHAENPRICHNLLFLKKQKAIGAVSMNLLYPKTSLGHHMSVDIRFRKSFYRIGRELISGLHFVFQHLMPTKYFISYFYADKTYNDLMFRRFLHRYPNKEDYIYDRYNLYKCLLSTKRVNRLMPSRELEIKSGDTRLLKTLSHHLKKNLSQIEFEAFSFNKDEITLDTFSNQCLSSGYERKRQIFFAVDGEIPIAALIAETGSEGVNTFNLLNCCWVVFLISDVRQNQYVLEQLMTQAIDFYHKEKKAEFIFLDKYDSMPKKHLEKYGIKYLTNGMRWLSNYKITSAYLNYIEETLGMLYNHFRPY